MSKQKKEMLNILQDTLNIYDEETLEYLESMPKSIRDLIRKEWLDGATHCCQYLIKRLLKDIK